MRRVRVLAVVCAAALLGSCEPRTIEVEGLDELTAEIRSQRKLLRSGGMPGAGGADAGTQIQSAMSPLRDVLTQMGQTQRELSERQAALTQEMRRWTQLLVQSMQSERADEAKKLGERLGELERTIAAQDKRHRQVEELMGTALDRTADQLEEFLRRIGAPVGPAAKPEEGATPTGGGEPQSPDPNRGSSEGGGPLNENRSGATGGAPASTERGGGNGDGSDRAGADRNGRDAEQRGSLGWLWGLAVLSLVSGFALLFGRRRTQPVSMAPEMQRATGPGAELVAAGAADWADPDPAAAAVLEEVPVEPVQPPPTEVPLPEHLLPQMPVDAASGRPVTDEDAEPPVEHPQADSPEVEELWAAAALLGEAIGRLKQTSGEPAREVPGKAADAARVEELVDDAPETEEPIAEDFDAEDVLTDQRATEDSASREAADKESATADLLADARALDGDEPETDPSEFELDDLFVIDEDEEHDESTGDVVLPESLQADDVADDVAQAGEQPLVIPAAVPVVPPTAPIDVPDPVDASKPIRAPQVGGASSGAVAVRHASSAPETCCLQLRGDAGAEGRLRSMLGRDPRVLVSPAPEVRSDMGGLEVRFALLPGLTAGERSLLEQQLRDTVA